MVQKDLKYSVNTLFFHNVENLMSSKSSVTWIIFKVKSTLESLHLKIILRTFRNCWFSHILPLLQRKATKSSSLKKKKTKKTLLESSIHSLLRDKSRQAAACTAWFWSQLWAESLVSTGDMGQCQELSRAFPKCFGSPLASCTSSGKSMRWPACQEKK